MRYEFPMRGESRYLTADLRKEVGGAFIELADGYTHYELTGLPDAPTIVLVNGFSVPYQIWEPTFAALDQAGYRVLRYDLFGRGYSDRSFVRYDLDLFTRQLAQLLDALEIGFCEAIFGLSMGGVVAANFAVQHRERVGKLVLVDPAGFPLETPSIFKLFALPGIGEAVLGALSTRQIEKILGNSLFDPNEIELVMDWYRPQMTIKGFRRALLSTIREGVAEKGVPVYRKLGQLADTPVFLFWGTEDKAVPFHFSKVFLSLVPQTQFQPISGAGHIPHYQQANLVNPMILEFINAEK